MWHPTVSFSGVLAVSRQGRLSSGFVIRFSSVIQPFSSVLAITRLLVLSRMRLLSLLLLQSSAVRDTARFYWRLAALVLPVLLAVYTPLCGLLLALLDYPCTITTVLTFSWYCRSDCPPVSFPFSPGALLRGLSSPPVAPRPMFPLDALHPCNYTISDYPYFRSHRETVSRLSSLILPEILALIRVPTPCTPHMRVPTPCTPHMRVPTLSRSLWVPHSLQIILSSVRPQHGPTSRSHSLANHQHTAGLPPPDITSPILHSLQHVGFSFCRHIGWLAAYWCRRFLSKALIQA